MSALDRTEITIGWKDHLNATCIDCRDDIHRFGTETVTISDAINAARTHDCPSPRGEARRIGQRVARRAEIAYRVAQVVLAVGLLVAAVVLVANDCP